MTSLLDKFSKKKSVQPPRKEDERHKDVKKETVEKKEAAREHAGRKPEKSADKKKKEKATDKAVPQRTDEKKEREKHPYTYQVVIKPLVTEKGTFLQGYNTYLFEVAPHANKIMIQHAVETIYHVEVVKVRVMNMRGKRVRSGRQQGKRKNWKKAVVTLKQGQRITTVEGV